MKVLFLLTQSLDRPGGGGRFFPFAKALSQAGINVEIISLHHNFNALQLKRFVKDGVSVTYVGQMHILQQGGHKHYYGPLKLLAITVWATVMLTWHAIRSDAEIIQVCKPQPMNCVAAWFAYWSSFRQKRIFIDADDYEAGNNRFSGGWQQQIVSWFENRSPKQAEVVFVGNQFIATHFENLGFPSNKFVVLYNGVDRERFAVLKKSNVVSIKNKIQEAISFNSEDFLVVYIGSISLTSHGLDILINAFKHVVKQCDNVNLLLIGNGEDSNLVQDLIGQNQLESRVKMIGRIDSDLIPYYFSIADLSVDPMHLSVAAESSISMKMIESIASETPCITSDIGDRRLVGRQSVAVVPAGDPLALGNMICRLLNSPDDFKQMVDAAKIEKEMHYWDNKIESILYLYK